MLPQQLRQGANLLKTANDVRLRPRLRRRGSHHPILLSGRGGRFDAREEMRQRGEKGEEER